MQFEFATAARIVFGPGTLKQAAALATGYGTRALLVSGRDLSRVQPLRDLLRSGGIQEIPFAVPGEPEMATVVEGTALGRQEGCQFVISCGGGSAIDAGKAVAAMLTNPGELLDYLEVIGRGKSLPNPAAPFIAIPTTAGTGSEVTRNAVLGAPEHRVKVSLRSQFMLARVALVDPELTYGLPWGLTASTGMDALTQLIEPYVCARANPLVDALCGDGIRRVARSLVGACERSRDVAAREDMSLASLFGGIALANAGLGAVHGFAGPVGGRFAAPHGAVCAALLPHVMAANIQALRDRSAPSDILRRYQQVAAWVTGDSQAVPEDGVEWVRRLVRVLNIPGLSAYGIGGADVPGLVAQAMSASSMKANPVALTQQQLAMTLEAAL